MNILSNFKNLKYDIVNLKEGVYNLIKINGLDNKVIAYKNTDNSDNNILDDLLECRAYATSLLYLNENYILETGKFKDIFEESGITVEDYYSECNDLLNENIEIVEEAGIPLTEINGYKIFEGAGYILRGNGNKKIKESFDEENAYYIALDKELDDLISKDATDKELDDFLEKASLEDNISNEQYTKLVNKAQDTRRIEIKEDGTQTSDIAPKVDQDMNKDVTTSKKKHYDILLSGLDEGLNILNKGFLKNSKGQYQRGNYILVKEGDKYLAIHKDKLKEGYEDENGQMSFDENGLPELPRPYYFKDSNNKYYISSSHPYDETDYSWSINTEHDINGTWKVYDPNPEYNTYLSINDRPAQNILIDTVQGWQAALELMQNLDNKKKSNIDKS